MSTTSIVVERNKLREQVSVEKKQVEKPREEPVKSTKFKLLMKAMYTDMLETVKSVVYIFAVLALCKFSGLYDWWIQLINNG